MWVQHAPIVERQHPFPVVIFSHGIGGTRNAYSGICSELGSAVRPFMGQPLCNCVLSLDFAFVSICQIFVSAPHG